MGKNIMVIRDPKTFYFNFNKKFNVDKNLKHKIEFIIKSNRFLAENRIEKRDWTIIIKIQSSWTQKTAKQINHINHS